MSAQCRTILLVGDRFTGFSVHDGVYTVSQFISELALGGFARDGERTLVRAAQGVTLREQASVCDEATRLGLDRLEFRLPPRELAPRHEVHKHESQNTLISGLRRTGDGHFAADLRVHNDNELLLDHQTGQHVQGMVAIEAARQMFLAVSERFYADRHPDRSYYYVIESMNTTFENFLFPLDATVTFETLRAEVSDPTRLSFTADIGIHQAGRRASLTSVAYTAFESDVIEAKEHKRAAYAVRQATQPADRVLVGV
jgi:hypothetical protein